MRPSLIASSLMLILPVLAMAAPTTRPTTQPSSITLRDINGVARQPLAPGGGHPAVVIFISADCPICNGYAAAISALFRDYADKGVALCLVHADADLTDRQAADHAREYHLTCPVIVDRNHELVKRLGATKTPEAFVVGADGTVIYRGKIDDLYVSLGRRRYEARVHYLRDAIDAGLAGKAAPTVETDAVGCTISD